MQECLFPRPAPKLGVASHPQPPETGSGHLLIMQEPGHGARHNEPTLPPDGTRIPGDGAVGRLPYGGKAEGTAMATVPSVGAAGVRQRPRPTPGVPPAAALLRLRARVGDDV